MELNSLEVMAFIYLWGVDASILMFLLYAILEAYSKREIDYKSIKVLLPILVTIVLSWVGVIIYARLMYMIVKSNKRLKSKLL